MYKETEYRARCRLRGLDDVATDRAVRLVDATESVCKGPDGTLVTATLTAVEDHVASLVAAGTGGEDELLALARYFVVVGADAHATRLLAYLLPIGVLPAMAERLCSTEGCAVRDRVMAGVSVPPPGSRPEAYPKATETFVLALEGEVGPERARRVLTWNVHEIPAELYATEREAFVAAPSIDAWLEGLHARHVTVLGKHADDGTLWYEQKITPAVVEFVRSHPEILGGVRKGDRIYVTKIPYDPDRYIVETDPIAKRKLACHCPLAAASIHEGGADVPALWCACSAGYEKFVFDVVFGEETEAEVLQSALDGSELCRYAVRIPAAVLRTKG